MKGSNATSARAKPAPRPTGPSSAKPQPTPTSVEGFTLEGPSNPPDPEFNAYRKDLADIALAGRVIASHYAVPVQRNLGVPATLRTAASDEAPAIRELAAGDPFALLDDTVGWAWGYAGEERRVGYVRSDALSVNH